MYYIVIIKNDSQAIFSYETLNSAMEKLYSEMAYALNQNITTTCMIIDSNGAIYKSEAYRSDFTI